MDMQQADPKGLIGESYRIDGITAEECRSIFLDWALSIAEGVDVSCAAGFLINHYASMADRHPMSDILQSSLIPSNKPKLRKGRFAKLNEIKNT